MVAYSKILTKTDVSTRLAVNSSWLNDFFPPFEAGQYRQDLVVEDENAAERKCVLCIRRGRHKKPYISQATWLRFVVKIQAEVGDKVVFSRETDGATGSAFRYKIIVMKPVKPAVKLLGSTIDYAPRIPNN